MKLDFLPDGAEDCPLVRIWGFLPVEARLLHEAVTRLAGGQAESVEVHSQPGVEPIDGCQLTLRVGPDDRGVYALIGGNSFECLLCPALPRFLLATAIANDRRGSTRISSKEAGEVFLCGPPYVRQ
jgi:hypothetical protein